MKIYNYSDTGEFISEGTAGTSPLDGLPLIPRNATTIAPHDVPPGSVAVFDGNAWSQAEDHRGEIWYKNGTRIPVVIDFIGKIDLTIFQEDPEPFTADEKWTQIREKRNGLLAGCDWTQLQDSPVNAQDWATYRQSLRNIPQDFDSPDDVVWPIRPQ